MTNTLSDPSIRLGGPILGPETPPLRPSHLLRRHQLRGGGGAEGPLPQMRGLTPPSLTNSFTSSARVPLRERQRLLGNFGLRHNLLMRARVPRC